LLGMFCGPLLGLGFAMCMSSAVVAVANHVCPKPPGPVVGAQPPTTAASPPQMMVTVPQGVKPGDNFPVSTPAGAVFYITVPPGATPGTQLAIGVPQMPNAAQAAVPTAAPSQSAIEVAAVETVR